MDRGMPPASNNQTAYYETSAHVHTGVTHAKNLLYGVQDKFSRMAGYAPAQPEKPAKLHKKPEPQTRGLPSGYGGYGSNQPPYGGSRREPVDYHQQMTYRPAPGRMEQEKGMSSDINRLNDEMAEQKRNYQSQLNALQQLLDVDDALNAPQEADNNIRGHLESLREAVQTFAKAYSKFFKQPVSGKATFPTPRPEFEQELRMVIPHPEKKTSDLLSAFKSMKNRRYFIQGWVHLAVWKFVFSSNRPDRGEGTPMRYVDDLWLQPKVSSAIQTLSEEIGMIC